MNAPPLPTMAPAELWALLRTEDEVAVLDVREEGVFARGHLLLASSLPLSRLEPKLRDLVPRRTTPIVLCDDADDGLARRAATMLGTFGYTACRVLAGGVRGWADAGFELFEGINVPSKAFGEFVEQRYATPSIGPDELQRLREGGSAVLVLDSRPIDEYRAMHIPGGIDCPGAELVYRLPEIAPDPDTLVVVNCAGRTRSIIGAQSLLNAGAAERVVALRNGTMGWHLAGLPLERGDGRRAPDPSASGLAAARGLADAVAARFAIRAIDRDTLATWRAESGTRSLYLLDVRSPEEYASGHLPGSRPAPGGQLVQRTDAFVGTRNARLVLIDGDGVRATMTASWLVQMGFADAFVLTLDAAGEELQAGEHRPDLPGPRAPVEEITVATLADLLPRGEVAVVDLDTSLRYRAGHIPGAWFAIRARLAESHSRLPPAGRFVVTSADGTLARLAAPELAELTGRPVQVLAGGTDGWRAAGLPLQAGLEQLADTCDDVFWRPYDREDGVEDAMRAYLAWEHGLLAQIERDATLRFRSPPEAREPTASTNRRSRAASGP